MALTLSWLLSVRMLDLTSGSAAFWMTFRYSESMAVAMEESPLDDPLRDLGRGGKGDLSAHRQGVTDFVD